MSDDYFTDVYSRYLATLTTTTRYSLPRNWSSFLFRYKGNKAAIIIMKNRLLSFSQHENKNGDTSILPISEITSSHGLSNTSTDFLLRNSNSNSIGPSMVSRSSSSYPEKGSRNNRSDSYNGGDTSILPISFSLAIKSKWSTHNTAFWTARYSTLKATCIVGWPLGFDGQAEGNR